MLGSVVGPTAGLYFAGYHDYAAGIALTTLAVAGITRLQRPGSLVEANRRH